MTEDRETSPECLDDGSITDSAPAILAVPSLLQLSKVTGWEGGGTKISLPGSVRSFFSSEPTQARPEQ